MRAAAAVAVLVSCLASAVLVAATPLTAPVPATTQPQPRQALPAAPLRRTVAASGFPPADAPAPETIAAAERTAVTAVDGFWQRHFTELFQRPYRSPRVAGGYQGRAGPTCAGRRPASFNAFYCGAQDFLAWDESLMIAGYQRIGDSWVYLIIAHEWGHAIQARVSRYLVSVAIELQADCLAGAALAGAQRDGLIQLRPGVDRELGAALTALADSYPWTNKRDHGNAQQRIGAYNLGVGQGVLACLAH